MEYLIFNVLAVLVGTLIICIFLRRRKLPKMYIGFFSWLNIALIIFCSMSSFLIITGFTELGQYSLGGAIGTLITYIIFANLTPDYKRDYFDAISLSAPAMYGIGKIGCSFAGCCGGRNIFGFSPFPIQIVEAIVFLFLFLVGLILVLKNRFNSDMAIIIYAIAKTLLDFFRFPHETRIITLNQVLCLLVIVIIFIKIKVDSGRVNGRNKAHK